MLIFPNTMNQWQIPLSISNARSAVIAGRSDYLPVLEAAWQKHLAPRAADAPTVISTFAGCGGSSLGYSMAGYRELLAVEWDQNACDTFRLNFPDIPVYQGDIGKLSVEEVLTLTGLQPSARHGERLRHGQGQDETHLCRGAD